MRPVMLVSLFVLLLGLSAPPVSAQSRNESSKALPNSRTSRLKVHSRAKKPSSSLQQNKGKSFSSKKKTSRKKRSARPKGQLKPDAERTREIQEKLIDSGAMAGPSNGVWDSQQMEGAIRKFQQMHGLNATGKLDVKTLKAMGLKS